MATTKPKVKNRPAYGLGRMARMAGVIARDIARDLKGVKLDGPHARQLILDAGLRHPLVGKLPRAQALVDGWEGRFGVNHNGTLQRCAAFSAGRQLAVLKGVFA